MKIRMKNKKVFEFKIKNISKIGATIFFCKSILGVSFIRKFILVFNGRHSLNL